MGFFSWITKDTNRSISNKSSSRGPLTVWMHTPDGKHYEEHNYHGYGLFGGEDYYVELARANPLLCVTEDSITGDELPEDDLRSAGIDLEFSGKKGIRYPIFTESETYTGDFFTKCETCEDQGFFYDDSDSDEEEHEEAPVAPSAPTKKRQRDNEGIMCEGRTGQKLARPTATVSVREDGSLFIRVDDENNLEFWLEMTVPSDAFCARK